MYKIGDVFIFKPRYPSIFRNIKYTLTVFENNKIALVNNITQNFWKTPIPVKDTANITLKEFKLTTGEWYKLFELECQNDIYPRNIYKQ